MTATFELDVLLVFIGLFLLTIGFINRDKKASPFILWIGIMCMMAVLVYHIVDKLG
ncbi:DUF5993 family protein [Noviherbaspirillum sedimenti]|uniref:DUF5993 family protein n=1 Tax=Noviherbaspirillum sedimenti TaxID=2320865 RepID=UPI00131455D6|nr:DUF5993 family protein [Noviherbaspirillum sedimenti]